MWSDGLVFTFIYLTGFISLYIIPNEVFCEMGFSISFNVKSGVELNV